MSGTYVTFACSECDGDGCELCEYTGTEDVEDISHKFEEPKPSVVDRIRWYTL